MTLLDADLKAHEADIAALLKRDKDQGRFPSDSRRRRSS